MKSPEEIAKELLEAVGSHDEMCMDVGWSCKCLEKIMKVIQAERSKAGEAGSHVRLEISYYKNLLAVVEAARRYYSILDGYIDPSFPEDEQKRMGHAIAALDGREEG